MKNIFNLLGKISLVVLLVLLGIYIFMSLILSIWLGTITQNFLVGIIAFFVLLVSLPLLVLKSILKIFRK